MIGFIRAYIKSMRLYYSFVTGIAGWLGVASYEFEAVHALERTTEVPAQAEKKLIILLMLFLSWGINQIINDFLGLREDRINAPNRPMVTGELDPAKAVTLSVILMILSGVVTWFYLEPVAVAFLVIGFFLNIVYEYAKGYGILGNVVFGLMIVMAPLYGAYASGPTSSTFLLPHRVSVLILVWVINGLMTYYTYFKDYRGDRAAGKKTLVVKYGLRRSRIFAVFSAFLPSITFLILRGSGLHRSHLDVTFYILALLTFFLQLWTGFLYYLKPTGVESYASLKTNFRACVCGQATLIAIFNPELAIWLFIFSYIFVGFLFELHVNPNS